VNKIKVDIVKELRLTAFDHVERTWRAMEALLKSKGYVVANGLTVPRVLCDRLKHSDYFANLALGECMFFNSDWNAGDFRGAAKHAYFAGLHRSRASYERESEMHAQREAKRKKQVTNDTKLLDMVRAKLIEKKGVGSAADINSWISTGKKLRAFQAWFTKKNCREIRAEIRNSAKVQRLVSNL
jgi:hypothetical protein